jgi:hypothetical protein
MRITVELNYVKASVLFFAPCRGGRHFVPIRDGYAPYVRVGGLAEDLPVRVNGMPINGQYETSYEVDLELSYHPKLSYSALQPNTVFEIIEGPKIIGEGIIISEIFQRPI